VEVVIVLVRPADERHSRGFSPDDEYETTILASGWAVRFGCAQRNINEIGGVNAKTEAGAVDNAWLIQAAAAGASARA
jgi:hypothetical protein